MKRVTVIDNIIEDPFTQYGSFTFPCIKYKDYVILFLIKYYINMRLRQYTRQTNQEKVKNNAKKKVVKILYYLKLLNYNEKSYFIYTYFSPCNKFKKIK